MKVISHRGNLTGRIPNRENDPSYISEAIDAGYDVEVDVWYVNEQYYLGHDFPQYRVCVAWLKEMRDVLWCHAKNSAALEKMLDDGLHCFWHETDRFTITSRGVPWCYPGNYIAGGITVMKESCSIQSLPADSLGVCTDYSEDYRKLWTS